MSLYETIKKDQQKARVERNAVKSSVLTTLLGELQTLASRDKSSELTDGQVITLIKKFISNNEETFKLTGIQDGLHENEYLKYYLPKQLTSSQLKYVIENVINQKGYNNKRDLGKIIQEIKNTHEGQFEAKNAIQIINELLQ